MSAEQLQAQVECAGPNHLADSALSCLAVCPQRPSKYYITVKDDKETNWN